MDIGLFGGSFNPPHVAHLVVAEIARDQLGFDEVWWIPNATPPHKSHDELAAVEHRLAMTRRAIADNPSFRVSEIEVGREGVSYTVDTLRVLQDEHPDTDFGLLLGSDSLDHFGEWHRPDEIMERVPLVVYKRPGIIEDVPEPRFANRVRFVSAPVMEVSGTEIRSRRRAGRSIRYLVPETVRSYIREHNLYRGTEMDGE
ncbi:nicotinate (nicotinamide) nucleotide adenylyltransferase [Salinibacter sp. 10B]|uniref:nicotinate (nicotinamide) nucleotide adenylyltransferase n=1 Tax=Salinibacter sp. 10B TaxID=1923971 RepID=UPI000CF387E6|nr:nicotinate (nicotinamide) nucleotide adenylyltransferase [Salinibacter sp. 10B]PQJ35995.1 nicotinate (nicotinamide) nucleotide adenylyltransferase [Salinibacter sp. 10B]